MIDCIRQTKSEAKLFYCFKVDNLALRKRIIETYQKSKDRHHHDLLRRHEIIEKRKEEKERYHTERVKEKTRQHEQQVR